MELLQYSVVVAPHSVASIDIPFAQNQ